MPELDHGLAVFIPKSVYRPGAACLTKINVPRTPNNHVCKYILLEILVKMGRRVCGYKKNADKRKVSVMIGMVKGDGIQKSLTFPHIHNNCHHIQSHKTMRFSRRHVARRLSN